LENILNLLKKKLKITFKKIFKVIYFFYIMKKGILIFIIILTLPYVLSLSVSLSSPVVEESDVTLKCTVTDSGSEGITQLDLYNDISGTYSLNQTNTSAVSSGSEFSFEKIIGLSDATYNWNCHATNSSSDIFTASSNSSFTISSSNNAPGIEAIGAITINEDTPFSIILSNNISDDSTSDTNLKFTYTNGNPSIVDVSIDNSTNNLSFSPILNKNGESSINVIVWDSELAQNSSSFTLTITPINDEPTNKTSEIEDQSWFKNRNREINLKDYFIDPDGDSLTYSASQPSKINIIIDNSTGEATLTPNKDYVGNQTTTFTAYDSNFSSFTSNTINLIVKDVTGLNNAPTIDTKTPSSLTLELKPGEEQLFSITKSDIEGDTLTVRWYLGSQLVSEENSYKFSSNNLGTYTIEVVVSDGTLTDSVEWLVSTREEFDQNETNFTVTTTKKAVCGNNVVDAGESCSSCPQDVTCNKGEVCIKNRCTSEKKSNTTIIIIVVSIIVLIGIATAFYLYKKKQQDLGLEDEDKKTPKKELAPAADLEDFYKEPKQQPKVALKKPRSHRKVNKALIRTFIRESLKRGHSKEKIKSNLLKTGWKEQEVDLELNKLK
tara:strand:- start:21017 stop:22837 length:1821 start_codon:yes stop_codon:yes gene_type:complete